MDKKRVYSIEDVVRILLNPMLDTSGVLCSKVPTSISGNMSFVVDTSKLEHKDDILADDMGMWKNNRVDREKVVATVSTSRVTRVDKCSDQGSTSTHTVKRVYRVHGTNRSLKKMTACLYGEFLKEIKCTIHSCFIRIGMELHFFVNNITCGYCT